MNTPQVTVVMTVYNTEKYIGQAVASILGQSFKNFELLVVDDASTDRSMEIVLSFGDPRIRLIRNSANKGVAYSRKRALAEARGAYIAVLDADDVACEDRLRLQVEFLEGHPEIGLLGSAFDIIDADGNVERSCSVPVDPLANSWKLLFGNHICHSTVMFRRQVGLGLGGYDGKVFAGEDFDLWVRFAAYSRIAQLDRSLVRWRRYKQSLYQTEGIEVKDHFVWSVVKSIRLQTKQEISYEAARFLLRDPSMSYTVGDDSIVLTACATVEKCLSTFLSRQELREGERKHLVLLAFEEIVRILVERSVSLRRKWQIAWSYTGRLDCRTVLSKRFARVAVKAVLPFWALLRLRSCRDTVIDLLGKRL